MSRAPEEGRNRPLSAEDAALWAHVAAKVRPLAERAARQVLRTAAQETEAAESRSVAPRAPAAAREPPPLVPLTPSSRERLARGAERKLKRGAVVIGARLDLHGLDRAEAHRAVTRFLTRLADEGERVALVITGKGGRTSESGPGVLRAEFPRWLSEGALARLVLAWRPAAARHGGDGAFYVLLRRKGARS